MKSNYKKAMSYVPRTMLALLLALLTGACVSSSKYEQLEDQYKQSEARAEALENANKELNDRIAELTEEIEAKDAEIKSMSEAAADSASSEEMSVLLQEKAALQRELASLRAGKRSMDMTFNGLSDALKQDLEDGNIKISQVEGVVRLTIEDNVFFDSGRTAVNASGREVLDRLANAMKDSPDHSLIIEGYTDDRRIGPKLRKKYATNWDLGAARAINVVRYLTEEGGISDDRLSAQTFGPNRATADNSTPEGRAANRRIQISVIQTQKVEESDETSAEEMLKEKIEETEEEIEDKMEEISEEAEAKENEALEPITEVKSEEGEESSDEMEAEQPAENTP
ncbi:MAG: OmpA family protein [bacterium]|nr:OmpA family protein [bacterium]